MDITSVLDIIKGARIMRHLILTKEDHFSLQNQRQNIIDSSEDNLEEQKVKLNDKEDKELEELQTQLTNINRIFNENANQMDDSQK